MSNIERTWFFAKLATIPTCWLIDLALVTLACSTFSPFSVSGSLHTHPKDFLLGRFPGRRLSNQLPTRHNVNPVGHGKHLVDVAGYKQNSLFLCVSEVVNQTIDFCAGTRIDSKGRLIEDQDPATRAQPLCEHHLLFVPAAEILDLLSETGRPDVQGRHRLFRHPPFPAGIEKSVGLLG
jgi:hypothetical protein